MKHFNIFILEKLTLNSQSKLVQLSDDEKKNTIIQNIIKHKKRKCPKKNQEKYFGLLLYYHDSGNNHISDKDKEFIFDSDYIFQYFNDTSNIEDIIYKLVRKLYGYKYDIGELYAFDDEEYQVASIIGEFDLNKPKFTWDLETISKCNTYMYNKIKDTSSQS